MSHRLPASKHGVCAVINILSNEQYYGAALLQKTYTEDFIIKKGIKHKGVLPQYYIERAYKPIVNKEAKEPLPFSRNITSSPLYRIST